MKIIVDAFGGDHAPLAVIEGCRQAVDELGAEILLTGDEEKIRQAAAGAKISLDGMEIVHAPSVIPVEEDPTTLLKKYADSSMAVGLRLLSEGKGEAFVSAGSTGALVVGSTLVVKRVKGVRRIAIGTLVPNAGSGYLLVDAGANHDCRPEMLLQFALMGSAYMEKVQGIQKPRVGLVNIGTEENKGTQLQLDVLPLLKEAHPLHWQCGGPRPAPGRGGCGCHRRLYRQHHPQNLRGNGQVFLQRAQVDGEELPRYAGRPLPGGQAPGTQEEVRLQRGRRRSTAGFAQAGDQGPWQLQCQGI